MADLTLERQAQPDETAVFEAGNTTVLAAPLIDEDYWVYRVKLSETQAIVGFPKFGMIGIGFAVEDDWNTNLPASVEAEDIFAHIAHNKGDDSISDADCLTAIRMIQDAVRETPNG